VRGQLHAEKKTLNQAIKSLSKRKLKYDSEYWIIYCQ